MAKEKFERSKPIFTIGTIGHSDHGKTTLTAALIKLLAKRNLAKPIPYNDIAKGGTSVDETKTITTHAAYLEYQSDKYHFTHIDCPGLPDYTRQIYDGVVQMDAAILVVDATKGIEAQTREHVIFARQSYITDFIIFINKCDLVDDPERLDVLPLEVRELLNTYHCDGDNTPVICGAALPALRGDPKWEQKLQELFRVMNDLQQPTLNPDRPFLMNIANIYSVKGKGTVATGKIQRGVIKVSDTVELIGVKNSRKTVVTGVEMFKQVLDQGQAGDIASCLLRDIEPQDISRDQVLAQPGSITAHDKFVAEVYILTKEQGGRHTPIFERYRPQFFINTADVTGTIILPDSNKMVMPGDKCQLTVKLDAPIYMQEHLRFIVRDGDQTIGMGVINKILQ